MAGQQGNGVYQGLSAELLSLQGSRGPTSYGSRKSPSVRGGTGNYHGREHQTRPSTSPFTSPTPAVQLLERFGITPAAPARNAAHAPQPTSSTSSHTGRHHTPVVPADGREPPWTPNGPNDTHVPYARGKLNPVFAELLEGNTPRPARATSSSTAPAWRPGGGGAGAGGGSYVSRGAAAAAARARATSRQTSAASPAAGAAPISHQAQRPGSLQPGSGAASATGTVPRSTPSTVSAAALGAGNASNGPQSTSAAGSVSSTSTSTAAVAGRGPRILSYSEWADAQSRGPTRTQPPWRGPNERQPLSRHCPPATGSPPRTPQPATPRSAASAAGPGPAKARSSAAPTVGSAGAGAITSTGFAAGRGTAPVPNRGQLVAGQAGAGGLAESRRDSGGSGGLGASRESSLANLHSFPSITTLAVGRLRPATQQPSHMAGDRDRDGSRRGGSGGSEEEQRGDGVGMRGQEEDVEEPAFALPRALETQFRALEGQTPWGPGAGPGWTPVSHHGATAVGGNVLLQPQPQPQLQRQPGPYGGQGRDGPRGVRYPPHTGLPSGGSDVSAAAVLEIAAHALDSGPSFNAHAQPHMHQHTHSTYGTLLSESDGDDDLGDAASFFTDDVVRHASVAGDFPFSSTGMKQLDGASSGGRGFSRGLLAAIGATSMSPRRFPLRPQRSASVRNPGAAAGFEGGAAPGAGACGRMTATSPMTSAPGGMVSRGEGQENAGGATLPYTAGSGGVRVPYSPQAEVVISPLPSRRVSDSATVTLGLVAWVEPRVSDTGGTSGSVGASGSSGRETRRAIAAAGAAAEAASGVGSAASGGGGAASGGDDADGAAASEVKAGVAATAREATVPQSPQHPTQPSEERRERAGDTAEEGASPTNGRSAAGNATTAASDTTTHGSRSAPGSAAAPPHPLLTPVRSFRLGFNSEWLSDDEDGTEGASDDAAPAATAAAGSAADASPQPQPAPLASSQPQAQGRPSLEDNVPAWPGTKPPLPQRAGGSPAPARNAGARDDAALRLSVAAGAPWHPQPMSPNRLARSYIGRQSLQARSQSVPRVATGPALPHAQQPSSASHPRDVLLRDSRRGPAAFGLGPGPRRSTNAPPMTPRGSQSLLSFVLSGSGPGGGAGAVGAEGAGILRGSVSGASTFSALSGPQAGVMYNYPSHGYVERAAEYGIWEASMLYDLDLYDSMQLQGFSTPEEYDDPMYALRSLSGAGAAPPHLATAASRRTPAAAATASPGAPGSPSASPRVAPPPGSPRLAQAGSPRSGPGSGPFEPPRRTNSASAAMRSFRAAEEAGPPPPTAAATQAQSLPGEAVATPRSPTLVRSVSARTRLLRSPSPLRTSTPALGRPRSTGMVGGTEDSGLGLLGQILEGASDDSDSTSSHSSFRIITRDPSPPGVVPSGGPASQPPAAALAAGITPRALDYGDAGPALGSHAKPGNENLARAPQRPSAAPPALERLYSPSPYKPSPVSHDKDTPLPSPPRSTSPLLPSAGSADSQPGLPVSEGLWLVTPQPALRPPARDMAGSLGSISPEPSRGALHPVAFSRAQSLHVHAPSHPSVASGLHPPAPVASHPPPYWVPPPYGQAHHPPPHSRNTRVLTGTTPSHHSAGLTPTIPEEVLSHPLSRTSLGSLSSSVAGSVVAGGPRVLATAAPHIPAHMPVAAAAVSGVRQAGGATGLPWQHSVQPAPGPPAPPTAAGAAGPSSPWAPSQPSPSTAATATWPVMESPASFLPAFGSVFPGVSNSLEAKLGVQDHRAAALETERSSDACAVAVPVPPVAAAVAIAAPSTTPVAPPAPLPLPAAGAVWPATGPEAMHIPTLPGPSPESGWGSPFGMHSVAVERLQGALQGSDLLPTSPQPARMMPQPPAPQPSRQLSRDALAHGTSYTPPSLESIQRLLESDLPTPAIAAAVAVLAGSLPQVPWRPEPPHSLRGCLQPAEAVRGRDPSQMAGAVTPQRAAAQTAVGTSTPGEIVGAAAMGPVMEPAEAVSHGTASRSYAALLSLAGERGMPRKPLLGNGEPEGEELLEEDHVDHSGGEQRMHPVMRAGAALVEGPLRRAVRLLAQSMLIVLAGAAGATAAASSANAIFIRPEDLPYEHGTSIYYCKHRQKRLSRR